MKSGAEQITAIINKFLGEPLLLLDRLVARA